MSKRLQVILDDGEYRALQRAARRQRMTVSAWVRAALQHAQRRVPGSDPDQKVAAVREAARLGYPTADPAEMLAQIEQGYLGRQQP